MTVREIALKLLLEIEASNKYVNLALNSHFADKLSVSERKILTALVYTTVENRLTYDYYIGYLSGRNINEVSPRVKNILRLGLCQLLSMDSVPSFAAVNESVKLGGSAGERSFINGVLRRAVREAGNLPLPDREKNFARFLSVKYSYPQKTVKNFIESIGAKQTEQLLLAFRDNRYTDITVNTLKITPEALAERFRADGYEAKLHELSPITVRISGSLAPRELYGFSEGLFFVQDAASAISALALGAKRGERIIDVCACPGGKSFASAILSEDDAEILAFDIHESKLPLIEDGRARLGLKSLGILCRDARCPDEALFGTADRVICDVPCSGLGVLGKKPDLRYKEIEDEDTLTSLQLEILEASSKYLKVGGSLLYSTCTLRECENRGSVLRFLEKHPNFSLVDFEVSSLHSKDGELTLYPHIHNTDGFYMAYIRRNG